MPATLRPGGTVFMFIPYVPQEGPGTTIYFRATINNIRDSAAPTWNEYNDMGRADPKVMYQSYTRMINVDFRIVALNQGEHLDNIKALNSLVEMTKPKYKSGLGYNGVYTKMVIGAYINEIGFLTNVDTNIDPEYPWVDDIPIYIDCSLSLRVLGEKKPSYKKYGGNYGGREFYVGGRA